MSALAYHIVWTSYGTWLPGDARGWVKWGEWGINAPDPELEDKARQRMAETPVVFTEEQRVLIEQTIRDHCRIRGWILHAVRARTNHVHVVVMADRDPDVVRDQFKAWCSRKLSDALFGELNKPLSTQRKQVEAMSAPWSRELNTQRKQDEAGNTRRKQVPVAKKAGRRRWFTEGGDKEIIDNEEYLANVIRYVLEGQ